MKRIYRIGFLILFCLLARRLEANNIQVTNARISNANTTAQYAMVDFDIAWENSWRDNFNWDAAWVFVKYRPVGSSAAWSHATLNHVNGTTDGHFAPSGSIIRTPSDGKGVFIHRDTTGSGNVSFNGCRLRWNYGADGVPNATVVDIKVFAIEMVHAPSGTFRVGDGEGDTGNLYGNFHAVGGNTTFQITSEAGFTLGGSTPGALGNHNRTGQYVSGGCAVCVNCTGDGCLGGSGDDFDDVTSQTLPAEFPKGYNGFYAMRYEMTQQQMVDMLNTCTAQQQAFLMDQTHFYLGNGAPAANRWGFSQNAGVWSTAEPLVPMIYLDWMRAAAYADWSGLRPMTELEFEKLCRGLTSPLLRGYPWGSAAVELGTNLTLSNQGQPNEGIAAGYVINTPNGNCWINGGAHTMQYLARVGIFAAHPQNNGRTSAGASFYGAMELGGNAWERAVSVGHPEGRKFSGIHGDGVIDPAGYANVSNWPGTFSGNTVSTNVGVGYRGGGMAYPGPDIERNARVSSRRVASGYWNAVIQDDGARFVRTEP